MTTISLSFFTLNDKQYCFKESLEFELTEECIDYKYMAYNNEFGLMVVGDTIEELLANAEDEFSLVYEVYAKSPDIMLTEKAKAFKYQLLGLIK